MGITVSESNTVRQMVEYSQKKKKLKKKEIIRNQLQYGVPQNAFDHENKENKDENPPIHQPHSQLVKEKYDCPHEQLIGLIVVRQKKQIGDEANVQSTSQPLSRHTIEVTPRKQRKQIIEFASKYLNWEKKSGNTGDKGGAPTTTSKQSISSPQPNGQPEIVVNDIPSGQIEDQRQEVRKVAPHRVSSISNPNLIVNRKLLGQFQKYDWEIPTEKDVLTPTKRLDVLPSMTIILSNKFNENVSCMDECKDEEEFQKNRRQIMRDLIAGRRQNPQEKLLSCMNFNQDVTSSKTCGFI